MVGSMSVSIPLLPAIGLLIEPYILAWAGWLTKKYFPAGSKVADKNLFPLSLIFILLINWGKFAKFASYFYSEYTFLASDHGNGFSLLCCILSSTISSRYWQT